MAVKILKPLPRKIPHFSNYESEANFWDTHDTGTLFEKKNLVRVSFARPIKHLISIRVDHTLLNGLKAIAARRHIPYQTLIHSILAEKLAELHRKK